jgi:hypothetical protein
MSFYSTIHYLAELKAERDAILALEVGTKPNERLRGLVGTKIRQ